MKTAQEVLESKLPKNRDVFPYCEVLEAMREFATLHAQRIADKMVDDNTAELRSLKQTIIESGILKFAPKHEMSFHDKVVFAIAELNVASDKMVSERLREELIVFGKVVRSWGIVIPSDILECSIDEYLKSRESHE